MVPLSRFLEVTLDQGPFFIPKDLRVQTLQGALPRKVSPEEPIPPDPPLPLCTNPSLPPSSIPTQPPPFLCRGMLSPSCVHSWARRASWPRIASQL